jgi:general secretion pathway protein K
MTRRASTNALGLERLGKERGFALVTVIWGLGLITLLIVSYMSTARLRLQTAFNLAGTAQADLIADGALSEAVLMLLAEQEAATAPAGWPLHDGAPSFCMMGGAAVAISVEDEGGKVDLNAAPQKLLQAMLVGFGVDMREADMVANAIVAFRSVPTSDVNAKNFDYDEAERPFGLKRAPFQSIMELDQTPRVSLSLVRLVSPFVTVHSRTPGVDSRTALPALFAALADYSQEDIRAFTETPFPNNLDRSDPRYPSDFNQIGNNGTVLVHIEVILRTGQTSVREAVISFREASGAAFAIKELRRGQGRSLVRLRASLYGDYSESLPDCG